MARWVALMTSLVREYGWLCLQPCVHIIPPPKGPCAFALPDITQATGQHCPCREHSQTSFLVLLPLTLIASLHPKHSWKEPLKETHYAMFRTTLPIRLHEAQKLPFSPPKKALSMSLLSPTCKQTLEGGAAGLMPCRDR